ncbi:MAG: helix-turn-helix domain-containing protein [Patescibacteria group bacterium]|nr:winged helix-turn-helix transcriptional regulator [Patescibacteria group bacterium]
MNEQKVREFLMDLGLDEFEAEIYLALVQKGILTTLELSREIGIDRSKVYRRLERMRDMGVVEEVIDEHRKQSKAVAIDRLEFLLERKMQIVNKLKKDFGEVSLYLTGKLGLNEPETKVLFYRGKDGIKQMAWNVLRASKEVVGYSYRPLAELVGFDFMKRWVNEFAKRRLMFRDLYSDEYLKTDQKGSATTYSPEHFQGRYIPSKILRIDHQYDIYNDVMGLYNWHEGEVFGVEIYNKKIAQFQKQLFEIVWKMGKDPR